MQFARTDSILDSRIGYSKRWKNMLRVLIFSNNLCFMPDFSSEIHVGFFPAAILADRNAGSNLPPNSWSQVSLFIATLKRQIRLVKKDLTATYLRSRSKWQNARSCSVCLRHRRVFCRDSCVILRGESVRFLRDDICILLRRYRRNSDSRFDRRKDSESTRLQGEVSGRKTGAGARAGEGSGW
jgi:hypothetical protein